MHIKYGLNPPSTSPGLLRKLVALVVTVAMIGLVLMFSAVLFVIILAVGTIAWAYLWWKTRELRKLMQSRMQQSSAHGTGSEHETFTGEVIEGEVISVERASAADKR